MGMNLKDRVKQLGNNLPLMENREKGELDLLIGKDVTVRDFGFLDDGKGAKYIAFIVDEDKDNFFFGGQVLTDDFRDLEDDGYYAEIVKNGVPIRLEKKMSKSKREYTAVKYL